MDRADMARDEPFSALRGDEQVSALRGVARDEASWAQDEVTRQLREALAAAERRAAVAESKAARILKR